MSDALRDRTTEKDVLGYILKFPALWPVAGLTREHFSFPAHRVIFDAATALQAAGIPATADEVRRYLRERNLVGEVGSEAFVLGLVDGVPRPVPAALTNIVQNLDEMRLARPVDAVLEQTRRAIHKNPLLTTGAIEHVITSLTDLLATTTRRTSVTTFATSAPDFIEDALRASSRPDIVSGLVMADAVTGTTGQPRDLKTIASIDVALAVATGMPAFNHPRWSVPHAMPVLILSNEDPKPRYAQRFMAFARGRDLSSVPAHVYFKVREGLSLDDPDAQRQLVAFAREREIGLTIMDPLRSLTACVDKGPGDLQPFALFLRRYLQETSSAAYFVHHETKPAPNSAETRRGAQRMSGGGLWSITDAPISTQKLTDTTSRFTPDGWKFAQDPAPFTVTLEIDGDAWRLVGELDDPAKSAPDSTTLLQDVLAHIRAHPDQSGSAIATALHKQKHLVLKALADLERLGLAFYVEVGKAQKWRARLAA